MVAFRDPHGIRPLVLGKREEQGKIEYMFASESVALDVVGFEFVRDVEPGEAIYITFDGQLIWLSNALKIRYLTPLHF